MRRCFRFASVDRWLLVSVDALLHLLSLHQFVKHEAEKGALRLIRVKRFHDGDHNGQLEIFRDFQLIS